MIDSVPSFGSLLSKSTDTRKDDKGKSVYSNMNDLIQNNEVTKTIRNYLLSFMPGGKALVKALEAKEKLNRAIKNIPKIRKKKVKLNTYNNNTYLKYISIQKSYSLYN